MILFFFFFVWTVHKQTVWQAFVARPVGWYMHDESVLSLILMHPELGAQTKGHSSWQWCVSMTWQQAWNTDSLPCSPPPLLPPSPAQLLLDPVPIFFLLLIEPCVSFSVPLMSLCSEGDVLKGQVDAHWRRLFKWKVHQQINKRNKHGELTHEHQQLCRLLD